MRRNSVKTYLKVTGNQSPDTTGEQGKTQDSEFSKVTLDFCDRHKCLERFLASALDFFDKLLSSSDFSKVTLGFGGAS